jgi:hypothetical protein
MDAANCTVPIFIPGGFLCAVIPWLYKPAETHRLMASEASSSRGGFVDTRAAGLAVVGFNLWNPLLCNPTRSKKSVSSEIHD